MELNWSGPTTDGDWNEDEVGDLQMWRDYLAIQVESVDDGLRLLFES